MLIREFFSWAERASAGARAEAAGALAKAYLYAELDPIDLGDAGRGLTLLLDDPSPLVRLALAEAFATAVEAPHHILAALAGDRSDIAAIVLARSPVLSDAELIDAVAIGDEVCQSAVARRPRISAALAGAVAEVGGAEANLILSDNAGAELSDFAVGRMLERFGHDGALRAALIRRSDIGAEMRHSLVLATAAALGDFAVNCGWMAEDRARRVVGEARDRATVVIASCQTSADVDLRHFVAHLRTSGHMTPALALRALLSGDLALFEAMLCDLSGKPFGRVGGLLRNPHGLGFAALYEAAGLPQSLLPAFKVALSMVVGRPDADEARTVRLDQRMVERVIAACMAQTGPEMDRLAALLRRFEAEAARDEARARLDPVAETDRALQFRDRGEVPWSRSPPIRIAA